MERVVICKSALPWAGGVKLGEQERKRRETDGRKDRQRVNDRDECEREGGKKKETV